MNNLTLIDKISPQKYYFDTSDAYFTWLKSQDGICGISIQLSNSHIQSTSILTVRANLNTAPRYFSISDHEADKKMTSSE